MEVSGKRADLVSESCELCLIEGLSTEADGYCNECDEHMCNKCFQHHVKSKLSRNHVLSPLGQSVPLSKKQTGSNGTCKIHVNEIVKYYCRKHDMVTCGDCNVANHHGCKMEFISKLADKFENSSEFKDIVRKIGKIEAERKENKAQLDSNRKENKACLDTALAEIKKFRKDINEHLDRMEKEIISEANKLAQQNDDIFDEVEKMLSLTEQDVDDLRSTLDANKIQGNTLFIRTKEYKPKLIKVDENVSLIRTKNVIRCFTFQQEKQLADMIKSGVKLGCFRRDSVGQEEPTMIQKTKQPIETIKPVMTSMTAEKQVKAKKSYLSKEEESTVKQKSRQSIEPVKPVLSVTAEKNVDVKQSYLPPGNISIIIETVKSVLSVTAEQNVEAKQSYLPPGKMSIIIETVKPVLSVAAEKNVDVKQSYLPPDPRAAGFDVGSRVRDIVGYGYKYGEVTQIDPTGYVTVRWDHDGSKTRENAGAKGWFDVELLPNVLTQLQWQNQVSGHW